jgi:2-oxoglutarate dehydrogenase E2 component (dihydrolipoamide succinyltransferase)
LLEKKNINLGFAAALPDGNLIVPNIKNAQNSKIKILIFIYHYKGFKIKINKGKLPFKKITK